MKHNSTAASEIHTLRHASEIQILCIYHIIVFSMKKNLQQKIEIKYSAFLGCIVFSTNPVFGLFLYL